MIYNKPQMSRGTVPFFQLVKRNSVTPRPTPPLPSHGQMFYQEPTYNSRQKSFRNLVKCRLVLFLLNMRNILASVLAEIVFHSHRKQGGSKENSHRLQGKGKQQFVKSSCCQCQSLVSKISNEFFLTKRFCKRTLHSNL